MSEPVKCFMLQPTDMAEHSLRRFTWTVPNKCSHHASMSLGNVDFVSEYDGSGDDRWPHDDPQWPKCCETCGYEFADGDQWQNNLKRLFATPDGSLYTMDSAPVGAMRVSDWNHAVNSKEHLAAGGGPHLQVKCPDACWWDIDSPASTNYHEGGSGWSRSGEPPNVTANPSIQTGSYHGWLRNGTLVEC